MIAGVEAIRLNRFKDNRGLLAKLPEGQWAEEFYTVSGPRVLRGLHCQRPPHHLTKLVCCVHGVVLDFAVDLRTDSPAYGEHKAHVLDGDDPTALMLPPGIAHGFLVIQAPAVMLYRQSAKYSPEHDAGIRWDSAGIYWPYTEEPVISERDYLLPKLADFKSPFTMALCQ